jgi:hypothetical protein
MAAVVRQRVDRQVECRRLAKVGVESRCSFQIETQQAAQLGLVLFHSRPRGQQAAKDLVSLDPHWLEPLALARRESTPSGTFHRAFVIEDSKSDSSLLSQLQDDAIAKLLRPAPSAIATYSAIFQQTAQMASIVRTHDVRQTEQHEEVQWQRHHAPPAPLCMAEEQLGRPVVDAAEEHELAAPREAHPAMVRAAPTETGASSAALTAGTGTCATSSPLRTLRFHVLPNHRYLRCLVQTGAPRRKHFRHMPSMTDCRGQRDPLG